MTPDDYANCDATELTALVRRGDVAAAEVIAVAETLLDELSGRLNFMQFPGRPAILPAGAHVPTLIKDVGAHIAGRPFRSGSRLFEGETCAQDSHVADALEAAGCVVMGSSAAPEFSLEGHTHSDLFGRTLNPWDPARSPGGSSGGAAAAVASGAVPVAHASDIAGSIRLPAAWCGVVGLKPSRGRVSAGPMRDEAGFGLASNFVLTRTVRDVARFLDPFARPCPGDPFSLPAPEAGYAGLLTRTATPRLRIAVTGAAPGTPAQAVALLLEEMGHAVTEVDGLLPDAEALMALADVWHGGFDATVDATAARKGLVPEAVLGPTALAAYRHAGTIDLNAFLAAQLHLNTVRRAIGRRLAPYDLWLTPTTPGPAPAWADVHPIGPDAPFRTHVTGQMAPIFAFTFVHNILGTPAISLPLGQTGTGLPLGVQLGAKSGREDLLVLVSRDLEAARPWAQRRPPIHATARADA